MAAVSGAYFYYMAYSKTLNNLLLHNGLMDFIIIWYDVPWVDLFQILGRKFDPTKNMAAVGRAYFHYMAYSETLKNLLHNGSMDFIIIWYECSLGGPILDSLKKF